MFKDLFQALVEFRAGFGIGVDRLDTVVFSRFCILQCRMRHDVSIAGFCAIRLVANRLCAFGPAVDLIGLEGRALVSGALTQNGTQTQ